MGFEPVHEVRAVTVLALSLAASLAASGCADDEPLGARSSSLVAVCDDTAASVPAGAWLCPESITVECEGGDGTASVASIHVVPGTGASCANRTLGVSDAGPFATGTHSIVVVESVADAGGAPLCSAELVVVDTAKPVATEHSVILWPANGLMHTVTPDDCVAVEDRCDGILHAQFTSATIVRTTQKHDRDGRTSDIVFAPDQVQLRAVADWYGDRTYVLGYAVTDAAGNRLEGSCTVVVPNDSAADAGVEEPTGCSGGSESWTRWH